MEGDALEGWQQYGSPTAEQSLQMDSRTTPFDRKRPFNEIDDGEKAGGETATASKSSKPSIFIPSSGFAPPISWNLGARSRIRTSLGANRPSLRGTRLQVPNISDSAILPQANPQQWLQQTPEPVIRNPSSEGSGAGDRVILNLEEQEQSESHKPPPYHPVDSSLYRDTAVADSEKDGSSEEGEVYSNEEVDTNTAPTNESTEGGHQTDAMMVYSSSNPEEHIHLGSHSNDSVVEQSLPQILADLDPEDLQEQLKYFYAARDSKTVDLKDPLRCLICSKEGHTILICPSLVCQSCQKVKDHFTRDCPQSRKCEKCRNRGHDKESCSFKLSRLDVSEIECDLCQRTGHTEEDCELRWRTSGRPWESDFSSVNMAFDCYECGSIGHLGNDCPTRNPRKPMGSSTWSAKRGKVLPMRGGSSIRTGIAIKGRAQQKTIIDLEQEDDSGDFIRPPIPPPSRQGQIQVLGRRTMPKPATQSGSTTEQGSTGNAGRASADNGGRGRRGGRRGGSARNDRDDPGHHGPDPVRLGGVRVGGRGDRYIREVAPSGDSYRPSSSARQPPPRPQNSGRSAQGAASAYRPMPSAAQSAWKKHHT